MSEKFYYSTLKSVPLEDVCNELNLVADVRTNVQNFKKAVERKTFKKPYVLTLLQAIDIRHRNDNEGKGIFQQGLHKLSAGDLKDELLNPNIIPLAQEVIKRVCSLSQGKRSTSPKRFSNFPKKEPVTKKEVDELRKAVEQLTVQNESLEKQNRSLRNQTTTQASQIFSGEFVPASQVSEAVSQARRESLRGPAKSKFPGPTMGVSKPKQTKKTATIAKTTFGSQSAKKKAGVRMGRNQRRGSKRRSSKRKSKGRK